MRASMEVVPILSVIILVATISTLILAIGAYIFYKIQEKKFDHFAMLKQNTEKDLFVGSEDFGGRKLKTKKLEDFPDFTKHYQPISESLSKQQVFDKTYQESERKRIKRNSDESKYQIINSEEYADVGEDKSSGIISWR